MHAPITTLVFDLDGTLYVNMELGREINRVACLYLAETAGMTVDDATSLLRETKARLTADRGIDATLSLACTELGCDIVELHRRFAAEVEPERFLVRDERVVELAGALAERFQLYVYTNNNRPLASRILEILGLAGFFSEVFTIEYSWRPKPDRETLRRLLDAIGATPSESLFIGDRYDIDLRFPAALGCGVFRVGSVEELLQLGKLVNEENL
ncbi:MAG TPA: HAD family hydrolase [Geobacteraceae bacterium]